MFKLKKRWILIFILITIILLYLIVFHKKTNSKVCDPQIILDGNRIISLKVGEKYSEPGYQAQDSCGKSLKNRVQVKNNVNSDVPGTYEIIYTVDNEIGNVATEKRFVTVTASKDVQYQDQYDNIDNQVHGWGVPNKKDGNRPVEAGKIREQLLQYQSYLIGPDNKTIYLTFDEGSNETYLDQIVDVLNQNDVKATFFFCKNYILDNPQLMKKLVQTGHSVGNHTANHKVMPTYATKENFQKYIKEITAVEEAFQSVTGSPMDRIYREPKGEYSYRSLQIMKDLGYRTYFWSVAYMDFGDDVSKEKAFQELTTRVHNGAIYLIHPKNKGNYEAMDSFIKYMKEHGYTFDLVKNIQ